MVTKKDFVIDADINIFSGMDDKIRFHHSRSIGKPEEFFLHINNFCEMYVFIEGNAKYLIEDKYYNLEYGDVIILQPNEIHRAVLMEECTYERYFILIPTNAFSYLKDSINSPIDCFVNRPFGKNNIIHLSEDSREQFMDILKKMDTHLENGQSSNTDYVCYGYLMILLDILNNNYSQAEVEKIETENGNHSDLLSAMLNYIHYNIADITSAKDIANHFYLSLPYISTFFSNHMKIPLSKYIQMKKIAKAKLLLSSGTSVTDACFESGFNNCSYFIKVFKKIVGITPLEYKNLSGKENLGSQIIRYKQ